MKYPYENRVGTFRVTFDLISEQPDLLRKIFADVLIVSANGHFESGAVEYSAFSPHFDKCDIRCRPPEYICVISTAEAGGISWEWKKVTAGDFVSGFAWASAKQPAKAGAG